MCVCAGVYGVVVVGGGGVSNLSLCRLYVSGEVDKLDGCAPGPIQGGPRVGQGGVRLFSCFPARRGRWRRPPGRYGVQYL